MTDFGEVSEPDLAVMATVIGEYWIRHTRRKWECFEGDLTMAYVLGEIGAYNFSRMLKAPALGDELPTEIDETQWFDQLKPCNAYSIAEATGMPRETVRRKILRLEELGWIRRAPEGGGVLITPRCLRYVCEEMYPQAFFEMMETYQHLRRRLPDKWFG